MRFRDGKACRKCFLVPVLPLASIWHFCVFRTPTKPDVNYLYQGCWSKFSPRADRLFPLFVLFVCLCCLFVCLLLSACLPFVSLVLLWRFGNIRTIRRESNYRPFVTSSNVISHWLISSLWSFNSSAYSFRNYYRPWPFMWHSTQSLVITMVTVYTGHQINILQTRANATQRNDKDNWHFLERAGNMKWLVVP